MKEDRSSNGSESRSWFERLSQALLGEPRDKAELLTMLREAHERGLIETDALAMLEGVMQVAERQVRDIMIPRSQMVVLEYDMEPDTLLERIIESGHSRFPVIRDNRDEVAGILLAKDMLRVVAQAAGAPPPLAELLRPAVYVPESKRLNVLLKEFRANRNHLAMVVNEYGGVAGMITIEDVLEEIVGEIEDEYDIDGDVYIVKHSENRYTVKALTPIAEFNRQFHSEYSDEEFDTIGGLVLNGFGHLPKRGEELTIGRFRFRVIGADSRRLSLLQVTLLAADEPGAEAAP